VRNLQDGRVEAWAQGHESAVAEFTRDVSAGPRFANVTDIEELVVEPTNEYSTFRIER
jgi:acylphosphatase